jgi:hypothetical protein
MVKWMDKQSKLVKFILALPVLNITWMIYRLAKSIKQNHTLGIVLGIIMLLFGWIFMWLIDIITILVANKVLWF